MAVKNIAKKCDMFFVIGSRNSSNSVRLVEVAKKSGCSNAASKTGIDDVRELIENSKTVEITENPSDSLMPLII